jgi:ABC-type multidrug transport system ATPase subunit
VRTLVRSAARRGAAVLWATQRLEEIRGFADRVTLLDAGSIRFAGTVPELIAHTDGRCYVLRAHSALGETSEAALRNSLGPLATAAALGESGHFLLTLAPDTILGDALAQLTAAGIQVSSCREERSEIEQAFLRLTGVEA